MIPPRLLEFVAAEYPPEALARRRRGRVLLHLTIDMEGRVTRADVAEPAGHGFDEAARAAGLRFRFAAASRGGEPITVRVPYAYEFELPDEPPAAAPVDPAAVAAPARPAPPAPSVEVTVLGQTRSERLRRSAEAVHVIETEHAQRQSADLGEVMARSQGIAVRRGGALGSSVRFSLNGLTDEQIRFFLDGVPLDLAGYPFGIGNVPVNLVERIEVYRGVVPIRFGADALGGAVNLVSDEDMRGTHGAVSYQAGSFGTHRLTLGARNLHAPTGLFTRIGGFFDHADNDYPTRVEVPDQRPETRGQLIPATAYRFHDGYRAAGGTAELGVLNRRWARRLIVKGFVSDFTRELQNNPTGEVPYGDVELGETSIGGNVRYEHALVRRLRIDAIGGYTRTASEFLDVGACIYNWFGQCARNRQAPGEIDEGNPRDDTLNEHALYARVLLDWRLHDRHGVRLSIAPTHVARSGEDRFRSVSPIAAKRALSTLVAGLEYETDQLDDRLENIAFVKGYVLSGQSEQAVATDVERKLETEALHVGVGDSLRYHLTSHVYAKASYEYATRLPGPDELFGNAALTNENLELEPEVSHNVNLGVTLDLRHTLSGSWRGDVNAFLREAENLILLLPAYGERFRNENVFGARAVGFEASTGWTSPRELMSIDANATYLDFRNTEGIGPFAPFEGDRIPNRPYLFANVSLTLQASDTFSPGDRATLAWHTRYVHEFYEFWESAGRRDSKRLIPDQTQHSISLGYLARRDTSSLGFTGEIQNLTDSAAYDNYGVQRPGRAVHFKTTAQF